MTASIQWRACHVVLVMLCLSCCACHAVLVMLCSCLLGVLLCLSVVLVVRVLLCFCHVSCCVCHVCVCVYVSSHAAPGRLVESRLVLSCRVSCFLSACM